MKIHDVVFVYHLDDPKLMSWHSRVHAHGDNLFEFHYFIAGSGTFKNGDSTLAISPGSLFFTYPNQVHGISPNPGGRPLTYYAVLFEFHQARDAPMVDVFDPRIQAGFPLKVDSGLRLKFSDIKSRYNSSNQFFRLSAELELSSLLFQLMGTLLESGASEQTSGQGAELYVNQVLEIFQNRVHENLRISEIASALKISEAWLIKVFKQQLGRPPAKYFQDLKLEVASSLLINTTMPLKEIAYRLSYSSQYHFSRNFSRFAKVSPSEYRFRYLKNNPTAYLTKLTPDI